MNKTYFYGIYDNPDEELFKKQCAALEKNIPNLRRAQLLEDADGSSYQHYKHPLGEVVVSNDYAFGDLYVESDFDLEPYFEQKQ